MFFETGYLQSINKHKKITAKQHKNHILEPATNIKLSCKLYLVLIYIF